MSDATIYTIDPQAQVGDSLGEHNYNILSIDTLVCNLSSAFFNDTNNYLAQFIDFASNVNKFNGTALLFADSTDYRTCTTATNFLSSYWNQHEFSILYPNNISTANSVRVIDGPTQQDTVSRLISLGQSYLTYNFLANNFPNKTKANVIFFLYNVAVNPFDPNNLFHNSFSAEISYSNRYMTANYARDDIHFTKATIIKYLLLNGKWINIDVLQ